MKARANQKRSRSHDDHVVTSEQTDHCDDMTPLIDASAYTEPEQRNTTSSWMPSNKLFILIIFATGLMFGRLTSVPWTDVIDRVDVIRSYINDVHNRSSDSPQLQDQSNMLSSQEINQIVKQYLPMVNYIAPSLPTDFTMVIPSYYGHLTQVIKYLMTMRKFCVECTRLPLILVVGNHEKPLFNEHVSLNPSIAPYFSNISIVTLPEITTLPWHRATNQTGYWQDRMCDDAKNNIKCIRSKFVHQSLKKMYGCLYAQTRFCWASDSESLFVRHVTVKALLQDYIDNPFIITNTWTKYNGKDDPVHSTVRRTMGIKSRFGRLLEYYLWVLDRTILAEVEHIFKQHIPTMEDFGLDWWLFIEVNYYAYIVHNQRRFPQYHILDMPDLFDEDWLANVTQKGFINPLEEARSIWENLPDSRTGLSVMYQRYSLKAHRCSTNSQVCGDFVRANEGVVLLLSEQPAGVFEEAMGGRLTQNASHQAT